MVYGAWQFAPLRIMIFLGKFGVNTYGVMCLYIHIYNLVKDQMSQMASTCADLFCEYIYMYIWWVGGCICMYMYGSQFFICLTERYHCLPITNEKAEE